VGVAPILDADDDLDGSISETVDQSSDTQEGEE